MSLQSSKPFKPLSLFSAIYLIKLNAKLTFKIQALCAPIHNLDLMPLWFEGEIEYRIVKLLVGEKPNWTMLLEIAL